MQLSTSLLPLSVLDSFPGTMIARGSLSLFGFTLVLASSAIAAVETWTGLDGQTMQAEFVAVKGSYVSFRKADGSAYIYPIAKLSDADRARVEALDNGSLLPTADSASDNDPAKAALPVGKITNQIAARLVTLQGKSLIPLPFARLEGVKYYAVYFSAGWCGPCHHFTPQLIEAYGKLKATHPEFEVVFVSSDRSEREMQAYMAEYKMPWPALRHSAIASTTALQRYAGNGIPNLVFIDADGDILSTSYVKGEYIGPNKVLRDIAATLAGPK